MSKREFIVQELVEGADVDCSVVAEDGEILAWTTQRGVAKTRFAAPATEIIMEPHPALYEQVARLLRDLRWSGVAHIDTILDARDGSYRILELNGRFWGSLLASTAAGVNFPALLVAHASGRRPGPPKVPAARPRRAPPEPARAAAPARARDPQNRRGLRPRPHRRPS